MTNDSIKAFLQVENLFIEYFRDGAYKTAVRDISFSVQEGESIALLGDSGSGKTTIIKALLGLLPKTARVKGDIRFRGTSLLNGVTGKEFRGLLLEQIGFIPQSAMNSLDPVFRIDQQFYLAIREHRKVTKKQSREMTVQVLESVGLSRDYATSYPHQLSGGMRQRVLIAMAQVLSPALLIADEPTTGLDVIVQAKVLETVTRMQKEGNQALLLVTHDWDVATEVCNRVIRLDQGSVILDGGPEELGEQNAWSGGLQWSENRFASVPALKVEDLHVSYSQGRGLAALKASSWKPVLDSINLNVEPGEILGVAGESGCGKSTLIGAIAGLVKISKGKISLGTASEEFLDLNAETMGQARRHIQMVFQDPYASLNQRWSVFRTVAEPLIAQGIGGVEGPLGETVETLVFSALRDAELDPAVYAARHPSELSGGERQRVAVARALVVKPRVIIADEPVSMLDDATAKSIVKLFRKLAAESGVAVILVTHNMHVLRECCDRVAVMYLGMFVEVGTGRGVLGNPQHPYTRALIDAAPGRRRREQDLTTPLGEPPSIFEKPPGCSFHPRCPQATKVCVEKVPELTDGQVACHHPLDGDRHSV